MKQQRRNLKKKAGSLLLAAAMIITSLPVFSTRVWAAEANQFNAGPSEVPHNFATKEQLKTFNTDDTDGSTASATIYFGKDVTFWWIAGSQSADSVTLFAGRPLAVFDQGIWQMLYKFDGNYTLDGDLPITKDYDSQWDCTYSDSTPTEVNVDHYGGSTLRTILKDRYSSGFSTVEKEMIKDTTIYTLDTKNQSVYTTTDKLYLPYGNDMGDTYITVGGNRSDSDELNNGLRIDKDYWDEWDDGPFWLCTPGDGGNYVQVASKSSGVDTLDVGSERVLKPALELDLSSVLFASGAQATVSDDVWTGAGLTDRNAMTLRLDGDGEKIGTVSYDAATGQITAKKDAEAEGKVALVVQGNNSGDVESGDWYYSVCVGETTVVTTDQIKAACNIFGEIDLAKCRIWLETTIRREDSAEKYAKILK